MKAMKKAAGLIVILLILSIVSACGAGKTENKKSSSTAAPVPKFDIEDFTWNGSREVIAVFPSEEQLGISMLMDAMNKGMENYNISCDVKYAANDVYKQESIIKEAVSEGRIGGIVLIPLSEEILEPAVAEALEAGIAVIMIGSFPDEYKVNGCLYTAYELTGAWAYEVADEWLEKRLEDGGEIPLDDKGMAKAAYDIYTKIKDGIYCANALTDSLNNSRRIKAVSHQEIYGEGDEEAAYNSAKTILKNDPDCRIFIAYRPEIALGYNRYIKEYTKKKKLDLADFCVISCYAENNEFTEEYEAAKKDPSASAVKGYATHGDELDRMERGASTLPLARKGYEVGYILLGSFNASGYSWEAGTVIYDDVSAENIYGYKRLWKNGDEDPAEKYRTTDLTAYLNEE